jgi:hypothetical protein
LNILGDNPRIGYLWTNPSEWRIINPSLEISFGDFFLVMLLNTIMLFFQWCAMAFSWCLDVMRFAWRVLWWMLRDIGVVDLSFECSCYLLQVNFW